MIADFGQGAFGQAGKKMLGLGLWLVVFGLEFMRMWMKDMAWI